MRHSADTIPADAFEAYAAELQQTDPDAYQQYATLAEALQAHANPAFSETPIWHTVAIPVAIAREDQLQRTLSLAESDAKAALAPPHIVISANQIPDAPNPTRIAQNLDTIKRFQQAQTEVPVAYFHDVVADGTPIGDIRNGAAISPILVERERCHSQGQPLHDMLHTTWDADTLRTITPPGKNYLAHLQERFMRRSPNIEAQTLGPQVHHEQVDEARFPAAHRLLAFYDIAANAAGHLSPAAYSINLTGFARGKGFGRSGMGEAALLGMSAKDATRSGAYEEQLLVGYGVEVSSRRLVGRMAMEYSLDYDALTARPQEQEDLSGTALKQDVSEAYFARQVAHLAEGLLELGFSRAISDAKQAGSIGPAQLALAREQAQAFVLEKAMPIAGGPYEASDFIWQTITDPDLWRHSAALNIR